MATKTAPETMTKTATMEKNVNFDFDGDLASGELISAITSITSSPSGLTFANQAYATTLVSCRVTGGTNGTTYTVDCIATTDDSQIVEGRGTVIVKAIGTS